MPVRSFFDQMGFEVTVSYPPARIISLVPSQTELLAELGLYHRVVGITKFCVHPSGWRKNKTIIGGTKKFNTSRIDVLQPDLIIGNKEENYREGIEKLRLTYPVWMSDITTLQDAISMITSVGAITDTHEKSLQIGDRILRAFAGIRKKNDMTVLYLIWKEPWMAAGRGTFIDHMLSLMGLRNVVGADRYPVLSPDEIKGLAPDLIFLSTEPFPFRETHVSELAKITRARVQVVNGEMFSWYGSRLEKAPGYFNSLRLP